MRLAAASGPDRKGPAMARFALHGKPPPSTSAHPFPSSPCSRTSGPSQPIEFPVKRVLICVTRDHNHLIEESVVAVLGEFSWFDCKALAA